MTTSASSASQTALVHRDIPTRPHPFEPSGVYLGYGECMERCGWCGLIQRDTKWHPAPSPAYHNASYGNGDGTRTCLTCGAVFPSRPEDAVPWDTEPETNTASQPPDNQTPTGVIHTPDDERTVQ